MGYWLIISNQLNIAAFGDVCVSHIKHANHMTMIMPSSDCLKTKGKVKIKLRDLCETLIVYVLLSTF